jgi:hypothetical protein
MRLECDYVAKQTTKLSKIRVQEGLPSKIETGAQKYGGLFQISCYLTILDIIEIFFLSIITLWAN